MKTIQLITLATLLTLGCGGARYEVTGSERAAGSDAVITVDEIEGDNVEVVIDIEHLPPPGRLGDGLTTYFVWFTPPNAQAQNAGILAYDADERRGRLRATFPERRFHVRVTAERNRGVRTPSEFTVTQRAVNVDD